MNCDPTEPVPAAGGTPGYSTEVFCTRSEVDSLGADWERLQWHPNADRAFFSLVARNRPEVTGEYIVAVRCNTKIVSLAACRLEDTAHRIDFGYRTLLKPRVRQLVLVHGGLMGDLSDSACRCLSAGLMRSFETHGVDLISLHGVREDVPLRRILSRGAAVLCRDPFPVTQAHWRVALPASPDQLFSNINAHHRRDLGRLWRGLERKFPSAVKIAVFRSLNDIPAFRGQAANIADKSYLSGMGVGFVDDEERQARLEFWARRGSFLGYILSINDQPCAFWQGTLYRDAYFLEATAFDPEFRRQEVGTLLLARSLEDVCTRLSGIRYVDFGLGDALYKRKFGTDTWLESSSFLYAPTPRGISVNMLRMPIVGADRFSRFLLRRLDLEQRIKTWLKQGYAMPRRDQS
jgi:ribosomal protein S18 acetylase RimI-like enzyme